jgi:hypothetical protein
VHPCVHRSHVCISLIRPNLIDLIPVVVILCVVIWPLLVLRVNYMVQGHVPVVFFSKVSARIMN